MARLERTKLAIDGTVPGGVEAESKVSNKVIPTHSVSQGKNDQARMTGEGVSRKMGRNVKAKMTGQWKLARQECLAPFQPGCL